MGARPAEVTAMRRAVELADRGRGRPHPNPLVGAVVLGPDGDVVGEGWHARDRLGTPHAEVVALSAAGERARGGTLVCTLEPCNHHGRTGPCVDAILAAGVGRVVVAVADPTPVAGGGAAALRARGVDVVVDVERDLAARHNEAWLTATSLGRPFVTLKTATTLDGRVAASDGSSRWITSAEARADGHRLRAECDAIAVGVGTVLADDPHLTARGPDDTLSSRQPLRVVLDTNARTPVGARVLDAAAATRVLVADDVTPGDHLDAVPVARGRRGVDLEGALKALRDLGVQHLLVEGGPRVATSFVESGFVDRMVAFVAPALMGSGASVLDGGAGTPSIADLRRLRLDDVRRVGTDVRLELRVGRGR